MLTDVLWILVGLAGLFFGGEWLVRSSARLATAFGIPTLVVGLTIVSFGTSAPELVVSLTSAFEGVSDIAIGNVIGSNIANIGLILGLSALVYPIRVDRGLLRREIPLMIAVSVIVLVMALDGEISRLEGGMLVVGYIAFNILIYRFSLPKGEQAEIEQEVETLEGQPTKINRLREGAVLIGGLGLLVVGGQSIVIGAVNIARAAGISELVIGLTLVAIGTSLPEIATSLIAAVRRHSDIAAGNVIGSNIVNLLAILGLVALVAPIPVAPQLLRTELPIMIAFALLPLPFIRTGVLVHWEGALLLVGYAAFVIYTVIRAGN